jgi:RNA polymerase sigma-70 factor (ECF subfamily)
VEHSDSGILDDLARGSPEAFEALYDRYAKLAYTVAMRVLSDPASAEETVQEAFLAVWRRSSLYQPERGSIRNWICTIVRNRAIDRLRGESGRTRYDIALDEARSEASLSDTWSEVVAELSRERIREALRDLPVEQRQTIELAYWAGYSQREISETMRVPLGTVKGRARLALSKLREALGGREESWQIN